MGCANSKNAEDDYAEEVARPVSPTSSDIDDLIRLKMVADAEHETFEAMQEAEDEPGPPVMISISDTDPHIGTKNRPSQAELDAKADALTPAAEAEKSAFAAEAAREKAAAEEARATAEAEAAEQKLAREKAEAEAAAARAEAAEALVLAEKAKAEAAEAAAAAAAAAAAKEKAEAEKAALEEKAAEERAAAEKAAADAMAAATKEKEELAATLAAAEEAKQAAEAEAAALKAAAEKAATEKAAQEARVAEARQAAREAKAATEAAAAEAAAAASAEATAEGDAEAAAAAAPAEAAPAPAELGVTEMGAATVPEQAEVAPPVAQQPPMTERQREAEAAKARMAAEMSGMKRREKSLYHRKKATTFVKGLAEEKHLDTVDPLAVRPLVQRQSSRTRAPSAGARGQLAAPAQAAGPVGPAARGARAPSQKRSVRKSIRNMFKSKRKSRRPRGHGIAAADTGPKTAVPLAVRKPGSVTVAEIDAGLPINDEYETLDPRAIEAARWTDKSIRRLIEEIKKYGAMSAAGQVEVTFGTLFEETANIFDALVGIIKMAKKYGVLFCKKDQLWQGQDDAEVITLLKDTHDGVVINRRRNNQLGGAKPKTKGFGGNALQAAGGNAKCHVCSKTVYQTEYVGASDKAFHKNCFRCMNKECNRVLKASDYCNVDDSFFCPSCYKRLVMAAGGAGKETTVGANAVAN